MPHIDMTAARSADDMPDMAAALFRAISAAADKDHDEATVLYVHGEPAAVIAPYGHEPQAGAATEVRFDQTAPPEARLVLAGTWGGSIRMNIGEFRELARAGTSSRFEAMAQIAESWSAMPGENAARSDAGPPPPVRPGRAEADVMAAGRWGQRTGEGAASFRCAACGEIAAVARAVPAGCPADLGPVLGLQSPDLDGVVVDYFGGTAWNFAAAPVFAAVQAILGGGPDPAALRQVSSELAPFWCPDCGQSYCFAGWHTVGPAGAGFHEGTVGCCPHGHEHAIGG